MKKRSDLLSARFSVLPGFGSPGRETVDQAEGETGKASLFSNFCMEKQEKLYYLCKNRYLGDVGEGSEVVKKLHPGESARQPSQEQENCTLLFPQGNKKAILGRFQVKYSPKGIKGRYFFIIQGISIHSSKTSPFTKS